MRLSDRIYIWFLMMVMTVLASADMTAQDFSVQSFRLLPNDVTAFISPVKDLNEEDCALIKVQAPEEFAFSTPLGIVKRVDKTGEIWLYLPKGTKKLTLKHPQWGVLRDYKFPGKLESHMTYEMRVATPVPERVASEIERVVETVRDTLILTRVDTMMVTPPKERIPFTFSVLASVGVGGDPVTTLGGIMAVAMWRHGVWAHLLTDFGKIGETAGECNREGYVGENKRFFTGKTRHSAMLVTGGAIHRISRRFNIYEGLGYGYMNTAWELAPSEGGGYVRNTDYSHRGLMFEVEATCSIGKLMLAGSVSSIKGREWFGSVGIGYRF
jgi:hypothetical protein